jgi:hypothetical protein
MSLGLGRMQRMLIDLIREHGRPMTFAEIGAAVKGAVTAGEPDPERRSTLEWWVCRPAFQRSLRRALHSLLDCWLIALGEGGRAEPHRYFIHPMTIYMEEDPALKQALQAALDADPGAREATRRDEAKMMDILAKMPAALEELRSSGTKATT